MTLVLFVAVYAALLVFLAACAARIRMYARAPMHLRWELYPIPGETSGGDAASRTRRSRLIAELRFIVPEVLFLKGLRQHNRRLWRRSFPFHFGLYLLSVTVVLLAVGAALGRLAPGLRIGPPVRIIYWMTSLSGTIGLTSALAGAVGLLERRWRDSGLRAISTPADFFNLVFFLLAFGALAAGCLLRAPSDPGIREIAAGLVAFDTALRIPGVLAIGLLLCSCLCAYIPMTHMAHFIGKYFTYHAVLWDDAPGGRGGRIEARVAEQLTFRPTWAAPHISGGGARTWAEIASERPQTEGKP